MGNFNQDQPVVAVPVECRCPCHAIRSVIHFTACCDGRCARCGRYFRHGLAAHRSACQGEQGDAPVIILGNGNA